MERHEFVDIEGDHLLGCRQDPIRSSRHDAIRDMPSYRMTMVLGKNSVVGLMRTTGPGDVFHPNSFNSRPAYFDVTVRNSFQPKSIQHSAITGGAAARAGEEEKDLRHEEEVESGGGTFFLLVVESFGIWSDGSLRSLRLIARKTTTRCTFPFTLAFSNLMQQLSVRLWQFNARMICSYLEYGIDFHGWNIPA